MRSKDYKRRALAALKGHWLIAVIAGFIALMLGGVEGFSMSYSININVSTEQNNLQNGVEQAAIAKFYREIKSEKSPVYAQ